MNEFIERFGYERAWFLTVGTLVAVIALGAALFPQRVYVDFIWQYYWGPVVADAHGWSCVAWDDGNVVQCGPETSGPTASPGYTLISYAGYIPILILLVAGIVLLLRYLDIERYRAGFYALFPFMLFGGALRVVEDANVAAYRDTGELAIELPWSGLLISPLVYVTVFFVALAALVVSLWLDRNGYVSGYEYPLVGIGTLAFALTFGYLLLLSFITDYATFFPSILAIVLVIATLATALTWIGIERFKPELNRGTGYIGLVVIWAHAVDGVANWLMLDWAGLWGLEYASKHPVNEALFTYTAALLPTSIVDVIGSGWPFFFVKIGAAVLVIWIFDETVFEDSPRFTYLLLVTVVAVGLGPGSRDMLRATFGI